MACNYAVHGARRRNISDYIPHAARVTAQVINTLLDLDRRLSISVINNLGVLDSFFRDPFCADNFRADQRNRLNNTVNGFV